MRENKTLNHLGVFAKYWNPGTVKTRLAASIGNENAAQLYKEFVAQTLERHKGLGDSRCLWGWPKQLQHRFSELTLDKWKIQIQPEGDLGCKMDFFFKQTLGTLPNHNQCPNEFPRVILIGTDSPDLPGEIIDLAFRKLATHDCVIGPSPDGGYYLIGLSKPVPSIFQDINWSSPQVLTQTRNALSNANSSWFELQEWNDVDEWQDVCQLRTRLEKVQASKSQLFRLDQRLLNAIRTFGQLVNGPQS